MYVCYLIPEMRVVAHGFGIVHDEDHMEEVTLLLSECLWAVPGTFEWELECSPT
jgi:hypothetical protein